MKSLADSVLKREEERLNIKIVDSSVCCNAISLLICGRERFGTNILKMHPTGVPTFKKTPDF